jgi:serine/threonine protein phosphatase PrpC
MVGNKYLYSSLTTGRGVEFKPYEDYAIADDSKQIYIICDGVTRSAYKIDEESPAYLAARNFALTAHNIISRRKILKPLDLLDFSVRQANNAVRELNETIFKDMEVDYWDNDLAGTVGIVSFIRNDVFYYAYVGDCTAFMVTDNTISKIIQEQTKSYNDMFSGKTFGRSFAVKVKKNIRNNINHPLAFGVFTGEDSSMDLVMMGSIKLEPKFKIVLNTDGLIRYLANNLEVIRHLVPDTIVEQAEYFDKELDLIPDDKTIITLDVSFGPRKWQWLTN